MWYLLDNRRNIEQWDFAEGAENFEMSPATRRSAEMVSRCEYDRAQGDSIQGCLTYIYKKNKKTIFRRLIL